ncbi:hypothetical protein [Paenibacillus sp. FSL R7-0128]|uniref:hypothetical protein n=1 Tax=Paenibacillus sp. FSL R7-0128 TaxID=2954529 RepID=UPI0030F54E1D
MENTQPFTLEHQDLQEAEDLMQHVEDMRHVPVQEFMISELLQVNDDNEMMQVLDFMKQNAVPLSSDQVAGAYLLADAGITDIFPFINASRKLMTPMERVYKMVDKLTLADRIRGNAKLSNLLKANANPANSMPTVKETLK